MVKKAAAATTDSKFESDLSTTTTGGVCKNPRSGKIGLGASESE